MRLKLSADQKAQEEKEGRLFHKIHSYFLETCRSLPLSGLQAGTWKYR